MGMVVKYTDYYIESPDWFIKHIQNEINLRNITGLTNGRVSNVNVSGEHPLASIAVSTITGTSVDWSGILPAISVVEGNSDEEVTTIGQGFRGYKNFLQSDLDNLVTRYATMKERKSDGLITDLQIQLLQESLKNMPNGLWCETREFREREELFIGVWAHNLEEKKIIGNLVRSIIYDMRLAMIEKGLDDINVRTTKGLVNFNFGKMLYGQESVITFLNGFRNIVVNDDPFPTRNLMNESSYTSTDGRGDIYKNYGVMNNG